MNRIYQNILFLLFVIIPFSTYSHTDTIYYNANWRITSKSQYSYYRLAARLNNNTYKIEDHYANGALQMEGYCDSLAEDDFEGKNGYFVYYDSSGNKTTEGNYVHNWKDGPWTNYFKYSKLVASIESYKAGLVFHTVYYFKTESKLVSSEGNYNYHSRIGLWKYYYRMEGLLKRETNYINDTESYQTYFDSVSYLKTAEGPEVNNKRSGVWKFYYGFGGKLNAIVNYRRDILNGHAEYYDSTLGAKISEGEYKDGKLEGEWKYWNRNKTVTESTVFYKNGLLDGIAVTRDTSGRIIYEEEYKNGLLQGTAKHYYDSSRNWSTPRYENGLMQGEHTLYDYETNKPIMEGMFDKGAQTGLWQYYYKNQKRRFTVTYVNGLPDGSCTLYDSTGNTILEGEYKENKRTGRWIYYFENGNDYKAKMRFKNDSLNGNIVTYYEKGKLKRDENYWDGTRKSGTCYDLNGADTNCDLVETRAAFNGNMTEYIHDNLVYPKGTGQVDTSGVVTVGFFINIDGSISCVHILKSIGNIYDQEARRLVGNMPNWIPEKLEGKPVPSYQVIEIVFKK